LQKLQAQSQAFALSLSSFSSGCLAVNLSLRAALGANQNRVLRIPLRHCITLLGESSSAAEWRRKHKDKLLNDIFE